MIDPARHAAQLLAVRPELAGPKKRPPATTCPGCRRRTRDISGTCPRCQVLEETRYIERLTVDELQLIVTRARAELERRAALIHQTLERREPADD